MVKEYLRDKRSPTPLNDTCSKVMRANKGKDTSPELLLRKALRDAGFGGYRLHWKVSGHPDICYPGKKLAIFVNGCFWHRCPHCDLPVPKTNTEFWEEKFKRNKERDGRKECDLKAEGWNVMVIWECEIKKYLNDVVERITKNM